MLIAARALQGAFGAALAPAALSLLSTTFTTPADRGKAFGIFGAISGAGGAVGLLLGGVLTEYASWRWCLYVNLIIAAIAVAGALLKLRDEPATPGARLDLPGVVTAATDYLAGKPYTQQIAAHAALASYHTVFWWSCGFFLLCSIVSAVLFRTGPLQLDPDAPRAMAHRISCRRAAAVAQVGCRGGRPATCLRGLWLSRREP